MQEGPNSKQQIVDKIKQSTNILVTVGANPSVDALASALGLTLMLIKLDKHATAVFSGVVPPAISFLEPNKTFENNVDSLRDFIIALDKEKADRLRYKVEDDVVRIFITPYRTKITDKDLQFSQGDFNVDLIIALGVEEQKDLDQAITAHGRILHDATVVTVNAGSQKSSLGSIDWQDNNASSLSEMLAGMAESLKPGILDQQISTAMLTGIVSSTERFSNQRTTPRVMTISAQLMAAGANQQLIATKLQTIPVPVSPRKEKSRQDNRQQQGKNQGAANGGEATANGEMQIEHEASASAPTPPQQPRQQPQQQPKADKAQQPAPQPIEPELPIAPPAAQTFNDLKEALQQETVKSVRPEREMVAEPPTPGSQNINEPEAETTQQLPSKDGYLTTHPSWQGREIQPPSMGGSLSATAEQALEDKQRSEQDEKRNRTILTHGATEQEPVSEISPEPEPQTTPEPVTEPASELVAEPPVEQPAPPVETPPVTPEPVPAPPLEQPAPTPPAPEPVSVVPETPVETPIAPEPVVPPVPEPPVIPAQPVVEAQPVQSVEPQLAPIPEPTPTPAPEPMRTGPTLEELEREAASHAIQSTASSQTLSELEEAARGQSVPAQPSAVPAMPPVQPGGAPLELPPLPPMPDFGTLPPMPGAESAPAVAPMPEPVLPQFPQDTLTPQPPVEPPQQQSPPPVSNDPTQFRIPTQP